ncbi:MAG TPA: response regulator, partial [Burkholderiaceae bacterium]|nr:response regulator [Burkholderiaceae bacterium]
PDMSGWRILDRLKSDSALRHIPVCVVSTDDARERGLQAGAISFLDKPLQSKDAVDKALGELYAFADRAAKTLVVVMPPSPLRSQLQARLEHDVRMMVFDSGASARSALLQADCAVIDDRIEDLGPEDILDAIAERARACQLPVVLTANGGVDSSRWDGHNHGFALRKADGLEELIAQSALLLHRSAAAMSDSERGAVEAVDGSRRALRGTKALIVDDDIRNIFALATVLDDEGMTVVSADNGRDAIRLVESDPTIDIVLMDIMMPEMDGIETMQQIRRLPRGRDLPMVAVTAKAMKGDRDKCIEAGAWDYMSKPVDPTHMLDVLRGWLCR